MSENSSGRRRQVLLLILVCLALFAYPIYQYWHMLENAAARRDAEYMGMRDLKARLRPQQQQARLQRQKELLTSTTMDLHLSTSGTLAAKIIIESQAFATGPVSYDGHPPDEAWAIATLLNEPGGLLVLDRIATRSEASAEARLFALCGMWSSARDRFDYLVNHLELPNRLQVLDGCLMSNITVRDALKGCNLCTSIRDGRASEQLRKMGQQMQTTGSNEMETFLSRERMRESWAAKAESEKLQ